MAFLLNEIRFYHNLRFRPFWVWTTTLIVAGLFLIAITGVSSASAERVSLPGSTSMEPLWQGDAGGKEIFDQKCAGCHSIGGGNRIGPDLQDIAKRRDLQWIKDFIIDPAKMIASDPTAQQLVKDFNNITMPNLGLSPNQVDELAQYLSNPGTAPSAPTSSSFMIPGDPAAGKKLFTGELAQINGGPACLSCHSVSGTGLLGGGALGPDLTHVVQRLGEPGLSAALKSIVFPTMVGPFQNRPLTPEEQANLVAFLRDSDQRQGPVNMVASGALTWQAILIFIIGLVGAGLLYGLLLFFWVTLKKRSIPHLPARKL